MARLHTPPRHTCTKRAAGGRHVSGTARRPSARGLGLQGSLQCGAVTTGGHPLLREPLHPADGGPLHRQRLQGGVVLADAQELGNQGHCGGQVLLQILVVKPQQVGVRPAARWWRRDGWGPAREAQGLMHGGMPAHEQGRWAGGMDVRAGLEGWLACLAAPPGTHLWGYQEAMLFHMPALKSGEGGSPRRSQKCTRKSCMLMAPASKIQPCGGGRGGAAAAARSAAPAGGRLGRMCSAVPRCAVPCCAAPGRARLQEVEEGGPCIQRVTSDEQVLAGPLGAVGPPKVGLVDAWPPAILWEARAGPGQLCRPPDGQGGRRRQLAGTAAWGHV